MNIKRRIVRLFGRDGTGTADGSTFECERCGEQYDRPTTPCENCGGSVMTESE